MIMEISKEAHEINKVLIQKSPQVYDLLSEAGRKAFFPKRGILAQTADAKGKKFNATIGIALDDNGKPLALEAVAGGSSLPDEQTLLYSPSYGQTKLRELWLDRIRKNSPSLKEQISLPVVTNAITHGLSLIGKMFINEKEKLILPDMIWGNYRLVFQHANFDQYPMFRKGAFNVKGLHDKLQKTKGKQALLLNFPNNPTGYSATKEDAEGIAKAIKDSAEMGNKILVICDDAYFGLFYEKDVFQESMFSRLANLHPNVLAVKADGITKEMYSWGLRIGFLTYGFRGMDKEAASILEDKTAGMVRGSISNSCTHSQFLAIRALEDSELRKQEDANHFVLRQRFEETKKILEREKYSEFFEPLPFNSGYFMCIKMKKDAEKVRQKLLKDFDTGTISTGNMLRIAFSSIPKAKLQQLFENIYKACKDLDS
jgi:aspartate/methionine/tyrosine aminotransferase